MPGRNVPLLGIPEVFVGKQPLSLNHSLLVAGVERLSFHPSAFNLTSWSFDFRCLGVKSGQNNS